MSIDEHRTQYLIEWRKSLWESVRQKEDGIWKFVSFFAAAVVLTLGFVSQLDKVKQFYPMSVMAVMLFFVLLITWGVLIVIDANFWLARNLIFISNIEREILKQEDFGRLLPKAYVYPRFRYSRAYSVHAHLLLIVLYLVVLIGVGSLLQPDSLETPLERLGAVVVYAVFAGMLWYTLWRDRSWMEDYYRVAEGAPGLKPSATGPPKLLELTRVRLASPLWRWGWTLTIEGALLFLLVYLINQGQAVSLSATAANAILVGMVLSFLLPWPLNWWLATKAERDTNKNFEGQEGYRLPLIYRIAAGGFLYETGLVLTLPGLWMLVAAIAKALCART